MIPIILTLFVCLSPLSVATNTSPPTPTPTAFTSCLRDCSLRISEIGGNPFVRTSREDSFIESTVSYLINSAFPVGPTLDNLLNKVLVVSPSSAHAERVFSKTGYIKNTRRTRLTTVTLDALVRLSMNGPNDIGRFPSATYASTWRGLQTGDSRGGGGGHQPSHPTSKRNNLESVDCQSGVPEKQIVLELPTSSTSANSIPEAELDEINAFEDMVIASVGEEDGLVTFGADEDDDILLIEQDLPAAEPDLLY